MANKEEDQNERVLDEKIRNSLKNIEALSTTEIENRQAAGTMPDVGEILCGDLNQDTELSPGTRFESWEIKSLLGTGGMSHVYLVSRSDGQINQTAALKILPEETRSPASVSRFQRERQILANLQHPNIATLLDVGITEEGIPWFVMEYVSGSDIVNWCKNNQLNLEQKLQLFAQVCAALSHAHSEGCIHRDIKPNNILVNERDGQVKLLDFGIASDEEQPGLTATGSVMGTPKYMSPEQAKGQHQAMDRRSDIFSLGVLLYQLIAGNLPFEGGNTTEITFNIVHTEPTLLPRQYPRDLQAVIFKCLEKNPENRYPSAKALLKDIQLYLQGDPISAKRVSSLGRVFHRALKYRWISGVILTLVILAISLAVYSAYQSVQTSRKLLAAEEFSLIAQDIQHKVRRIHMMPPQDVQAEYEQIKKEISTLAARIETDGGPVTGAGNAALGTAYVSMRKMKEAHEQFELAADAGWSSPEMAMNMAYTKTQIWEMKKREGRGIQDEDKKAAFLKHAKQHYYQAAIDLLESNKEKVALSDFANARLAYVRQDYDATINFADKSIARFPWHYESLKLAAEAHNFRFMTEGGQLGYDKLLPDFEAGISKLEKALMIGRSDPYLYLTRCSIFSVEIQVYQMLSETEKLASTLGKGIDYCRNAALLKDDAVTPWINLNLIYSVQADMLTQKGDSALDAYTEAIGAAKNGIALAADDARLYVAIVKPLVMLSEDAAEKGNPERAKRRFAEALDFAEKAVTLEPKKHDAWRELGRARASHADLLLATGESPEPAKQLYLEAMDAYGKSLEIADNIENVINRSKVAIKLAQLNHDQGNIGAALSFYTQSIANRMKKVPQRPLFLPHWHALAADQLAFMALLEDEDQNLENERQTANAILNAICRLGEAANSESWQTLVAAFSSRGWNNNDLASCSDATAIEPPS